ncbi:PREDICTED: olfactory receptor 2Z1-like [Gekko japonicus]|uniref:Olfactory receptor n=1 Tax=Gekko japonicus TaxID=146911 RepID=A0ABM1LBY3_GEKJA|nr:PREDICTED: olfactory receptor 2Z1-like [Gekko japonicus]
MRNEAKQSMGNENVTSWTEFLLVGLIHHRTPTVFFAIVLFMASIALMGNCLLLFLIQTNSTLHTPMYLFLSQLACMDMGQVLIVVPKMSVNFLTQRNTISLSGCVAQIFLTLTMGSSECFVLASMSYDRYVAICRPLQYSVLMRRKICLALTVGIWSSSVLLIMVIAFYVLFLPYCGSNVIDHFVCEFPALLKLSCADTSAFEKMVYIDNVIILLLPISVIVSSYVAILVQILSRRSTEGRQKALGTCLSHLCVVGIFYGASMLTYSTPVHSYSAERSMIYSVCITVVPPMLNPFIYSLRNRDVLAAARKLFLNCTSQK